MAIPVARRLRGNRRCAPAVRVPRPTLQAENDRSRGPSGLAHSVWRPWSFSTPSLFAQFLDKALHQVCLIGSLKVALHEIAGEPASRRLDGLTYAPSGGLRH